MMMMMMMSITTASTSRESVTARNTTTGTPFLRGRARMRRRNDRTAGAVLDSPSKRTVRTNARAPSSSEKKTTNGGNTKKKGEKERQQKIKEYWKDRRKVACQENDPMCLDIMRTPMKSFDEMEEEEQELNALAPEFMGEIVMGEVNEVPSFPVFKGEILNAPEETLNVVEFTFSWCRPCKKFAAKYERFAGYYGKVRFFKVVGDSDPILASTAKSMNVTATPHFFMFRGGKMVGSFTGTNEENFRKELVFVMKDDEKP